MNTGPAFRASVKVYVGAGVAKPNPKIGQALGPLGINMMQFCKEFNDRTTQFVPDTPMRVKLKAYADRTYTFVVKPPPSSWFLKKAAGLHKGSDMPGHNIAGKISIKYIYEIAKVKFETDPDLSEHDVPGIVQQLVGTANSMGL